jgi:hypothetical protein
MKEDLLHDRDLRGSAEDFLNTIEDRVEGWLPGSKSRDRDLESRLTALEQALEKISPPDRHTRDESGTHVRDQAEIASAEELEKAWDDLKRTRDCKRGLAAPDNDAPCEPNPRKLG